MSLQRDPMPVVAKGTSTYKLTCPHTDMHTQNLNENKAYENTNLYKVNHKCVSFNCVFM